MVVVKCPILVFLIEAHNEFYPVPPPYSVATTLPTYDEAEKAKAAAMAAAAAEAAQRVSIFTHVFHISSCNVFNGI